jgi:hypothetical protein
MSIIKKSKGYGSWYIGINSGNPDGNYSDDYCKLSLWTPKTVYTIQLPAWVLKPQVKRVFPNWEYSVVARLGRNYYDEYTNREYSIGLFEDMIQLRYGIQPHNEDGSKTKCWTVPWLTLRHVRHSFYDQNHQWIADAPESRSVHGRYLWDEYEAIKQSIPRVKFAMTDYDGELIETACYIDEREWRHGDGWFKWLGWVRKPIICRVIDIEFNKGTGERKGSWKGGTIGTSHSIELNETIYEALCKYAVLHNMKIVNIL